MQICKTVPLCARTGSRAADRPISNAYPKVYQKLREVKGKGFSDILAPSSPEASSFGLREQSPLRGLISRRLRSFSTVLQRRARLNLRKDVGRPVFLFGSSGRHWPTQRSIDLRSSRDIFQSSIYDALPPQVKFAPLPFPGLRGLSVLSA